MYKCINNLIGLVLVVIFYQGTASTTFAESLSIDKMSIDRKPIDKLSIVRVVAIAQKNDPWLQSNKHSQDALESLSVVAATLADPKMSVGIANIASDSFDFNQEAMTQFKVGISQQFSRGDSLQIKQRQLQLLSSQYPYQRENRRAIVAVKVAMLWLDVYQAQQSIQLIEDDRSLFEQLVDIAEASYATTVGKTRQQDIIRAQLELSRLEDRLTMLKQKQESATQQLLQWLYDYSDAGMIYSKSDISVEKAFPEMLMLNSSLYTESDGISDQGLISLLSAHSSIKAFDQKIKASISGIDLAKQKYKPQWGLNAGYGVRGESSTGIDRADLFSIGVSFDIPLFTDNRQDRQVQSAVSKSSSLKSKKWLMLRELIAAFHTYRAELIRITQRHTLYQQQLLPQMHEQSEASLTAYTNDDGDFAEVVRSRIAELNTNIDALGINVEKQKKIIQLNYLLMRDSSEIVQLTSIEENKTTTHTTIHTTIHTTSQTENSGENK